MKLICGLILLLASYNNGLQPSSPIQYLYPVAAFHDFCDAHATKICLLHQTSPAALTLWLWDPLTQFASKILHSIHTPAGVALLPDNSGFSFIEHGRLRIKKFNKRSAKTVEFSEPIYDMQSAAWIDGTTGYCWAKKRDHYALFQISVNGDCIMLAGGNGCDCMYPQKVDSELFYIERNDTPAGYSYEILQTHYPCIECQAHDFNDQRTMRSRVDRFMRGNHQRVAHTAPQTVVFDFGARPIIYLKMISATQGFVLEHPLSIENDATSIECIYHYLYHDAAANVWRSKQLFAFLVPVDLVLQPYETRLFESLLPLLPCYYDGVIYFVDGKTMMDFGMYRYSMATSCVERLSAAATVFAPCRVENVLYCGGSIGADNGPSITWIDDDLYEARIALPTLQ